jgi:hypothetical protein
MKTNFSKEIKIGNRTIGEGHPSYIIAEIGANFDQDIEKAKRLIRAAKECGADCAKFQSFKVFLMVVQNWLSLNFTHFSIECPWGHSRALDTNQAKMSNCPWGYLFWL